MCVYVCMYVCIYAYIAVKCVFFLIHSNPEEDSYNIFKDFSFYFRTQFLSRGQ